LNRRPWRASYDLASRARTRLPSRTSITDEARPWPDVPVVLEPPPQRTSSSRRSWTSGNPLLRKVRILVVASQNEPQSRRGRGHNRPSIRGSKSTCRCSRSNPWEILRKLLLQRRRHGKSAVSIRGVRWEVSRREHQCSWHTGDLPVPEGCAPRPWIGLQ